jgi:CheY-like chemotaxis protein
MGLRLTVRWVKLLYLVISFALIGTIAQLQGWGLESLSPLLLVVVVRGSILFGQRGRWTIAGLSVTTLQPDLVLMDVRMPVMDGVTATQLICDRFPQVKVLVLILI